ncbi:Protein transport protein sec23 [Venturia nashicola]|uniref:Protein transport protein sec23 n=1 Tax=Venturia nashicola TaxID=86259 RepID=A0A4Z1NNJ2_9PEZI|nr:Protein transport protein sec23 [Venturia nashicola]
MSAPSQSTNPEATDESLGRSNDSPLDMSFDLFSPCYEDPSSSGSNVASDSSTLLGQDRSSLSANDWGFPDVHQRFNEAQDGLGTPFMPSNPRPDTSTDQLGFPAVNQSNNGSSSGINHHSLPFQGFPTPPSTADAPASVKSMPAPEQGEDSALSLDEQRRKLLRSDPHRFSQRYWCPFSLCKHSKSRPQYWKYFFPSKKDRDKHFYNHKFPNWTPMFTSEFDVCLKSHDFSLGFPRRRDFQRGDPSVVTYVESLCHEIQSCAACQKAGAAYNGTATAESCASQSHFSYHNEVIHELDKQCGTHYAAEDIRSEAQKCAGH